MAFSAFKLNLTTVGGLEAYDKAFQAQYGSVEQIATKTMRTLSVNAKKTIRSELAGAGFSKRWQNALRVQAWPKRGKSVNAAVSIRHNAFYADVFEFGLTVSGKPLLWIPAKGLRKKIGKQRMTPKLYETNVAKLRSATIKGQPVLLSQKQVGRGRSRRGKPNIAFIGIPTASHKDRQNIIEAIDKQAGTVARLYAAETKKQAG